MKCIAAMRASLVLGLGILATAALAQPAPQPIPAHSGFVADPTHVLSDADRGRISARLTRLDRDKGSQLGVVIVADTAPETIEDFSQRVFTTWKLGRRGVDDGVLFVLSMQSPRPRMRIHVGYGLEGAIPDAVAKRILAEQARPALERSGSAAAVDVAVTALIDRIAQADVAAVSGQRPVDVPGGERLILGFVGNIVLILVSSLLLMMTRASLRVRYLVVWLTGIAAFLLYGWLAGNPLGQAGAAIWLVLALVFHLRYAPAMRAKAQAAAERRADEKRRVAVRQGRSVARIRAQAAYADASGPPPGLLGWLPYAAALLTLLQVAWMLDFTWLALGAGLAWAGLALLLGLFMNGTFLRNRRGGLDDGTPASWSDYGSSWSSGGGGDSGGSSGSSGGGDSGGDSSGGGDSGGGGASD